MALTRQAPSGIPPACLVLMIVLARALGEQATVKLLLPETSTEGLCQLPDLIPIEILLEGQTSAWGIEVNRNDVIQPLPRVFVMRNDKGGRMAFDLVELHTEEHEAIQSYHNSVDGASFVIKCKRDKMQRHYLELEGSVFKEEKRYRFSPSAMDPEIDYVAGHVTSIYTVTEIEEHHPSEAAAYKVVTQNKASVPSSPITETVDHVLAKRQVEIYYIDVLPVVDNYMYQRWFDRESKDDTKATQAIMTYLREIFTGVDMRMSTLTLTNRQIKIRLVTPVISKQASTSPFSENSKETASDGTVSISAEKLLGAFKTWLAGQTNLNKHDHAMLFTSYSLYGGLDSGIKFNVTKGLGYLGEICKRDGSSSSIVEDRGAYQSEGVAAHELGHGLGAEHDGSANACLSSDRYLMSDSSYPVTSTNALNPWKFSSCSSDGILKKLKIVEQTADYKQACLLSKSGEEVTSKSTTSVSQQCQTFYGQDSFACRGGSLQSFDHVCDEFYCRIPGTDLCERMSAASGTCCGNGKKCFQGSCVSASIGECPMDDSCPLGDQPGIIVNSKTCAQLESYYCYSEDIQLRCCATCKKKFTSDQGCRYGDKQPGCTLGGCGSFLTSGLKYDFVCCKTCNISCLDRQNVVVDGVTYNCTQGVQQKGKYICYKEEIHSSACCETCERVRDANNPDCPYGDRRDCSVLFNQPAGYKCPDNFKSDCCKTCPIIEARVALQTTQATTVKGTTEVPSTPRVTTVKGTTKCPNPPCDAVPLFSVALSLTLVVLCNLFSYLLSL